ncbi:SDR family oxidoreductase [Actinoplanes sp. CA-015351]|uniref:SDR family oxidoreductase n=1 Tax=Actinoplanes sp. CA-015351 TaxID=3239897 RepID=UPI003D979F86
MDLRLTGKTAFGEVPGASVSGLAADFADGGDVERLCDALPGVNIPGNMIHYGTSKTAMLAVGDGLAKLTKGTAVTVNSVLGGPAYSDGVAGTVKALAGAQAIPEEQMKAAIIGTNQTTLLQRFIEPAEIAGVVAFVASPVAAAINGAAVRVDGGVLTTLL